MVLKVLELHLACDILLVFYVPDALLMIGLPDGPTAHFKLSKLVLRKDIKVLRTISVVWCYVSHLLETTINLYAVECSCFRCLYMVLCLHSTEVPRCPPLFVTILDSLVIFQLFATKDMVLLWEKRIVPNKP